MRSQFANSDVYGCANKKLSADWIKPLHSRSAITRWRGDRRLQSEDCMRHARVQKTKPRRAAALRGSTAISGGDGGIRTLDPGFGPDAPLAGECLRPLGHVSQTFACAREAAQRSQDNSGFKASGQFLLHTFCARDVISMTSLRPDAQSPALSSTTFTHLPITSATGRVIHIKPDRVRMPYAARARRAPCTSRRSARRS